MGCHSDEREAGGSVGVVLSLPSEGEGRGGGQRGCAVFNRSLWDWRWEFPFKLV